MSNKFLEELEGGGDKFRLPLAKVNAQVFANSVKNNMVYGGHWKAKDAVFDYQRDAGFRVISSITNRWILDIFWYWARKTGKSFTVASLLRFLADAPAWIDDLWFYGGIELAVFGPTIEKASIVFDECARQYSMGYTQEMLECSVDITGKKIVIRGENQRGDEFMSTIWKFTASKSAITEGPTLALACIDEAQDVSDIRLEKSIDPMMATSEGSTLYTGTTTYEHEYLFMKRFFDARARGRLTTSPNIFFHTYHVRAEYDKGYKRYVEKKANQKGWDNPAVRAAWLCEVDRKGKGEFKFLEGINMRACRKGPLVLEGSFPSAVTIDVGRKLDATVAILHRMTDMHICNMLWLKKDESGELDDTFREPDGTIGYREQSHLIRQFLLPYTGMYLGVLDEYGGGIAVADYLVEPHPTEICDRCGIDFTGYPDYTGALNTEGSIIKTFKPTKPSKHRIAEAGLESFRYVRHTYPDEDVPVVLEYERQYRDLIGRYEGPDDQYLTFTHPLRKGYHDDFAFADLLRAHVLLFPIPADQEEYIRVEERTAKRRNMLGRRTRRTFRNMNQRFLEDRLEGLIR